MSADEDDTHDPHGGEEDGKLVDIETVTRWIESVLGPLAATTDLSRHEGTRVLTFAISIAHPIPASETPEATHYVRIHRFQNYWEQEVRCYEKWVSRAFGSRAPQLVAVREETPLALIVSKIPGRMLEEITDSPEETISHECELEIWRFAGELLVNLHQLEETEGDVCQFFGPCRRDGSPASSSPTTDASQWMLSEFQGLLKRAETIPDCLSDEEQSVIQMAMGLVSSVFDEERDVPVRCHRDYCPPNWLIVQKKQKQQMDADQWEFSGVIDFEFSYWDVFVTDFARFPEWEWMRRPELMEAFLEGYGWKSTPRLEAQLILARVRYGLSAIVWGIKGKYFGFAQEGRDALKFLDEPIRRLETTKTGETKYRD